MVGHSLLRYIFHFFVSKHDEDDFAMDELNRLGQQAAFSIHILFSLFFLYRRHDVRVVYI